MHRSARLIRAAEPAVVPALNARARPQRRHPRLVALSKGRLRPFTRSSRVGAVESDPRPVPTPLETKSRSAMPRPGAGSCRASRSESCSAATTCWDVQARLSLLRYRNASPEGRSSSRGQRERSPLAASAVSLYPACPQRRFCPTTRCWRRSGRLGPDGDHAIRGRSPCRTVVPGGAAYGSATRLGRAMRFSSRQETASMLEGSRAARQRESPWSEVGPTSRLRSAADTLTSDGRKRRARGFVPTYRLSLA